MCTISLRRGARGLLLTMNRDELRARAPELPPLLATAGNPPLRWLGPRDSARGGTWIGVNETGLTACLMNGNVPMAESMRAIAAGAPSRGAIVMQAMAQPTLEAALNWLARDFDPVPYPAFMLLLAAPERAVLSTWRGRGEIEQRDLAAPWDLVSSSQWESEAVLAYRAAAFREWQGAGAAFDDALPRIHTHRRAGEEAYGILVDRGYACTRSITQAEVPAQGAPIIMRYAPVEESPMPFTEFSLARAQ